MENLKYFAAMALFEQFHNQNKDVGEVIGMFIVQYLKQNPKHLFSIEELTSDLNKYYNFDLPLAAVDVGLSKIHSIEKDSFSQKYFIKGSLQNDDIDEKNVEKSIKNAFENLVQYVENRQKKKFHEWERTELLNALTCFLLDKKVDERLKNCISAFFVSCKNDEVKQQLKLVADGMAIYTGITSDITNSLYPSFTEKIVLYLDMEILFHMAGYNGAFYKQQFEEFFKLVREINEKEKKIELKYFSEIKYEVKKYFHSAEQILDNRASNDGRIAMQEILRGCKRPADIVKKTNLFEKKLEEYEIECDYTNYHETVEGKHYRLADAPENIVSFINVLRKGQNYKPIPLIGYILISGTSNLLEYKPSEERGYKKLAMSLSYITKFFWFSLNKGFGGAKNMITFDVVCRAQMALSFSLNKIVMQRCEELNKKYQNDEITKEDAARSIAAYRSHSKLPEDIVTSELDSDLRFIDDNSLSRIQNEMAQKDSRIGELESSNETLRQELNQFHAVERKKEQRKRRMIGLLLLIIDNLLLLIIFILAIFDYITVIIPKLSFVSQGMSITISFIGSFIIAIIKWEKIKKCWLRRIWEPFMARWDA